MKTRTFTDLWVRVAAALCLAAAFYGCGKDEPEAPATSGDQKAAEAPTPAEPETVPTGVRLFQYAPADPLVVAVLPSVQSLESAALGLSTRLAPPDANIQGIVAEWSAGMAESLGVEAAESPSKVLAGLGIDPDRPMAVYVDANAFSERFREEVERIKAETEAAGVDETIEDTADDTMTPPDSAEGGDMDIEVTPGDDEVVAPELPELNEGSGVEGAESLGEDVDMSLESESAETDAFSFDVTTPTVNPFEAAGLPAIVAAFSVHDADQAVAKLDTLLQQSPIAAGFTKTEKDAGGVTITVYDPQYCSYFVHEGLLFVGNDLAWLEQVAARIAAPGTLPEGISKDVIDSAQMVMAIRMDQTWPLVEAMTLANTLAMGPAGMMAEMQMASLDEMKELYSGTDPAIGVLQWTATEVAFDTRINLDKHPALKAIAGPATAMRLATVLPATTKAMMSIRLTPEMKAGIRKYWIDAVPAEAMQDPAVMSSVMGATQALESIDDEITVGITGVSNNIPTGMVMVGLTDPQAVIQQLGMFVMMAGGAMPEMPAEPGAIKELTVAEAVTVYYTVLNNALMVATVRAELEAAVEHVKASGASEYFGSLDPPMDPKRPRFYALSVKPDLMGDVMAMQGGDGAMDPLVQNAVDVIRELRVAQDMDGPWLDQHVGLYLNAP